MNRTWQWASLHGLTNMSRAAIGALGLILGISNARKQKTRYMSNGFLLIEA